MTSNLGSTQIPEEARRLLDQGNWKEAVDELGRALETDPRNLPLWRERANALVALNRFDDALFCYERMLAIDPADTSIYAEKAEVLQSLDRDDEALACYDRALEHAPANVSFLKAKALLLSRLKRVPEAILVYERLLQLRPQDPEFLIAIGDALISAGQIDQAVVAYFERAAAINPPSFGAVEWTTRGATLFRAGKPEKALEFYDKAIQANDKYAWAYQGKALVLRETPETTTEALHFFDLAIQLDPGNAWFYLDKGNIYFDRKEYELAAKCYAKAIELDPKYQLAWRSLGSAQEYLKQYDQALLSAEKTIELEPTSADAWVHKGFCLGYLRRLDESAASYRKALELDPENFWANSNMGWTLSEMQKNEEALPFYAAAIKADPKEAWPWVNRAKSLRDLDRVPEALAILNEALNVVTDKRDVLTGIGVIYTEFLFQHDKALPYFKQRLELDPTDVQARCDLAECLIRMGQFSEGRTEAEKLVGQWTDPEDECAMGLIILASYALEGDVIGRARQFQAVVEQFKVCCPEGKPIKQEVRWGFSGLVNTIRASSISAESKFLVLTAIDVQQGKLAHATLLFFTPAKPQTSETATDRSVTADAAQQVAQ